MDGRPADRQDWIYERLVEEPNLTYLEVYDTYSLMFGFSTKTFDKDWLKATQKHRNYQLLAQKAKDDARIALEVKTAKNGLKSRLERVMVLQKQCDQIEKQIELGKTYDTIIRKGQVQSFERPMDSYELSNCRKTLRELQAEISKIEGDYSPEKHLVVDVQPILGDDVYLNNQGDNLIDYETNE